MEETGDSLLLTGRAGTGKSTLLSEFLLSTTKKVVVLAPTGIAALNVHGETIHAFCGFTPDVTLFSALKRASHLKKEERSLYKKVEMIIIDEISMVRADLMDIVDRFLRRAVGRDEPFGGKQMIFIGDLYQLPPVLKREEKDAFDLLYKTPYFFSSQVIKEMVFSLLGMRHVELHTVYRQQDEYFIELLGRVRDGMTTPSDVRAFEAHRIKDGEPLDTTVVHLTTTNKAADEENMRRLEELEVTTHRFLASYKGETEGYAFPVRKELLIKEGARVMFVNNDADDRWKNGSLGTVLAVEKKFLTVLLDSGATYDVEKYKWDVVKTVFNEELGELEQKVLGSCRQFPLILAWAITIHKSQGQTFDRVCIDLGRGAFAEGQTYVALSRARSMEGLYFKRPLRRSDIKVDERIASFFKVLQQQQKKKGDSA